MAISRVPTGQQWLIRRMFAVGYQNADPKGICFGISHVAMEAALSQKTDELVSLLEVIASITEAELQGSIDAAKKKYADFMQAANEDIKKNNPHISEDDLKLALADRRKSFYTSISKEEAHLLNIPAFFESVMMYAQGAEFPHLFTPGQQIFFQSALRTSHFYEEHTHERKIVEVGSMTDVFTFDRAKNYVNLLKESLQKQPPIDFPISFSLGSPNHSISFSYDPTRGSWWFTDANQLPPREVTDNHRLAAHIMDAFHSAPLSMISTRSFVAPEHQKAATERITQWEEEYYKKNPPIEASKDYIQHHQTALLFAAKENSLISVKKLVEAGDDINKTMVNNITPILRAAEYGNLDIVNYLLSKNAFPDIPTRFENATALFQAVSHNHTEVAQALLATGKVNVNQQNYPNGETPLMKACRNGNVILVKSLLAHGADASIRSKADNKTVLDIATELKQSEMVDLLKSQHEQLSHSSEAPPTTLNEMNVTRPEHLSKLIPEELEPKKPPTIKPKSLEGISISEAEEIFKHLIAVSATPDANPKNLFKKEYESQQANALQIILYALTTDNLLQINRDQLDAAYRSFLSLVKSQKLHIPQEMLTSIAGTISLRNLAEGPQAELFRALEKISKQNVPFLQLRGINLSHLDFRQWPKLPQGINLKDANLSSSIFQDLSLKSAQFQGANLKGANFAKAQLNGVDFSHALIQGANFNGAKLTGSIFLNANDFKSAEALTNALFHLADQIQENPQYRELADAIVDNIVREVTRIAKTKPALAHELVEGAANHGIFHLHAETKKPFLFGNKSPKEKLKLCDDQVAKIRSPGIAPIR